MVIGPVCDDGASPQRYHAPQGDEDQMLRTILLQIHRYTGLVTLAFLAVASITGCILVFRGPIDHALNRDLFDAPSTAASATASVAGVTRWADAHPGLQVLSFPLHPGERRAIPLSVAAKPASPAPDFNEVFIDPQTGDTIGTRRIQPGVDRRHFIKGVADLHFDLVAGTAGRWFLGAVALAWLLSAFAGFYLTLPERGPFWRTWKRTWQFRASSPLPRLLLDLHRSTALWLFPFILLLAATSVAMNFFGEAYSPAVTKLWPLEHDLFDHDPPPRAPADPKLSLADGLRAAEAHAQEAGLAWPAATMLYLPDWNFYGVKFSPDGVLDYSRLGPVDYYVDADTGAYRHQVDPYTDSTGLKAIRVVYPLHSGEIFGAASVVLVFVLGLVTLLQALTGLYIWWKKRTSRVAARRAKRKVMG
jgi:uncharacterized iron-regulated membrane protein